MSYNFWNEEWGLLSKKLKTRIEIEHFARESGRKKWRWTIQQEGLWGKQEEHKGVWTWVPVQYETVDKDYGYPRWENCRGWAKTEIDAYREALHFLAEFKVQEYVEKKRTNSLVHIEVE